VVGTPTLKIKVKQNWRARAEENDEEAKLVLPAGSLKKDPLTRLRITMTTRDY